MILLAQRVESVLRAVYNPSGLKLRLNIGQAGGAGIASHIHMHALPRWIGDTNFMTVTANTASCLKHSTPHGPAFARPGTPNLVLRRERGLHQPNDCSSEGAWASSAQRLFFGGSVGLHQPNDCSSEGAWGFSPTNEAIRFRGL